MNWLDENSKSNVIKKLDDLNLVVGKLNKTEQVVIAYFHDVSWFWLLKQC